MKIRTRILIGFLLLYAAGSYFVIDLVVRDIRPRYLEAVEESLNDTAHLLATLLEAGHAGDGMDIGVLRDIFSKTCRKKISSRIYGLLKTDINLGVYVTDARGIVLYDSGGKNEGKNFSRWNDVRRTLSGAYGARSSRAVKEDPSTKALYVSAPVRRNGRIIGVVTVVKPENSVALFIDLAKRKIILAGLLSCLAFIVLGILLTLWINRPISKLSAFVKSIRENSRAGLPDLKAAEIRDLGLAFEEMRAELEGKEYIERYIQALAHEIKSPLSSIRGAAEILEDDMPPDRRIAFFRTIGTEAMRIDSIVEKLLRLAALEKRKTLKNIETAGLRDIVGDIIESLGPQMVKGDVRALNNAGEHHAVTGEKFLITHAILNLVKNAVQFTPAGGAITISTSENEKFTIITVTDNGAGIPDYAAGRIFERFYSLPGKDRHRGTGLGLPFVREVAALHGGYASVINNPDEPGVIATLALPRAPG